MTDQRPEVIPQDTSGRWPIARRRPEDRSVQSSVRSEVRYTADRSECLPRLSSKCSNVRPVKPPLTW
jgi:hypothetical protein